MKQYSPATIEKKWQKYWAAQELAATKDHVHGKENRMLLVEFPYPSGNLHIGHWYAFALPDMLARSWRMRGYNVLYPIGFDAFGLPAENAALKHGVSPETWTKKNIAHMTKQLTSMGALFDWSRAVNTTDPEYYRWTQWMFLRFWEQGLAYRAATHVNWCPNDKTVLANEQVVDGCCDRCGTEVVQKEIEQWMFRTTAFADELVDGTAGLDWPSTTMLAQRNWIGRSDGARIRWALNVPGQKPGDHFVETFTTRLDTVWGATFVVVSPELAKKWIDVGWQAPHEALSYVAESLRKRDLDRLQTEKNKTGVATGIVAINPLSGAEVPVWIADYVLGGYGTGAIMAVPAHDERDHAFAEKFGLPIVPVVQPVAGVHADGLFTGDGVLVGSGPYTGLSSDEARRRMALDLESKGAGRAERTYKLHDWVLSRQRYWGVPIPIINCPHCGRVPVPDRDLPVQLPKLKDWKPSDDGRSPLAKATKWLAVPCPRCGSAAERETDTMDTFVDSSWYYIRYTDPHNATTFADEKRMNAWLPVPMYVGGAEHNTMHLLYSRFFAKALHSLGHIPFSEPFLGRRNHGIILGPDGQKMSKSRGNVVDPDAEVAKYGADTVRMYLAFMAPYEQGGPWDPKGINGVYRFLGRSWKLAQTWHERTDGPAPDDVLVHGAIKAVGDDLEHLCLNTAVSGLMKLLNHLEECRYDADVLATFVLLLAPLAPHIAEEMWQGILKKKTSVHSQTWPAYDERKLIAKTMEIPVQVNGKVRDVVSVPSGAEQDDVVAAARVSENVLRAIGSSQVRKIIYIPRKMLNLVVG